MQQICVDGKRCLAALILRNRYLVLLGKGNQRLARAQLPFPPRCDHGHVGFERVIAELETHLVIALAGRPMGNGLGADLLRDLDLPLGDERPRDRRPQEIRALVERVRAEHREDVVAHELFAQILDEDVLRLDAEKQRLLARGFDLLALTEIGGEGDHLATIRGLQPLQDDRGVEPAGIGEHHFFHLAPVGVAPRHRYCCRRRRPSSRCGRQSRLPRCAGARPEHPHLRAKNGLPPLRRDHDSHGKAARTIGPTRRGASLYQPTEREAERSELKRAFCSSLSEL